MGRQWDPAVTPKVTVLLKSRQVAEGILEGLDVVFLQLLGDSETRRQIAKGEIGIDDDR